MPCTPARVLAADLPSRVFPCPDGLDLVDGPLGLQLIATRSFAAGEVLYRSPWFVTEDVDHDFVTTVQTGSGPREVHITRRNSVRLAGTRVFDVPGCFMNHACEPNSDSRYVDDDPTVYEQFAVRPIAPGDEITCNYVLFDWDCDGHAFTCTCGSPNCLDEIRGFSALTREQQIALAPHITDESLRRWKP